jgi:FkbM family methyltransferase
MISNIRTRLISKAIEVNEGLFFYPKLKKLYKAILGSNSTIIDVGCNKGQSIDFFLDIDKNAKIIAFEPNPKLFALLKNKFNSNSSITLINKGVSRINGELLFYENILDETSTFEELNYNSSYLKKKAKVIGVVPNEIITNKYLVDVCRLSDSLIQQNCLSIDVIKIDVEGHELECLQGLFENYQTLSVKYIQIESHNDDMYLRKKSIDAIDEILFKNGFKEYAKVKHGFGNFHEIIYKNTKL